MRFVGKVWAKCGQPNESLWGRCQSRSIWPMKTRVAAVAAVLAAMIAPLAPIAHADNSNDLLFVLDLSNRGVTYGTTDSALQAGNQLCAQLRGGTDPWAVRDYWADRLGTTQKAGTLMASAARYLCPEQLAILDSHARNQTPDIP